MIASKLIRHAPALILSVVLWGCAASAHFYSKNGQAYPPLTQQAVRCEENEIRAVIAAGGFPIGVVDARGLRIDATDNDLAYTAAKVAAKNGGTHVLLTEKGIETFTVTTPGQVQKQCQAGDGTVDCETTFTPPTTSTYEKPTAKFVVFVVPRQGWARLPPTLQPAAAP
jgi:hypothetical protein